MVRAVAAGSRPSSSNSRRSKFELTWMSMLGDRLGSTARTDMSLASRKRARMSLRLDATMRRGDRHAHPPRRPGRQHVAEISGRHRERDLPLRPAEGERGRHVIGDLRRDPRPVDRVHRRELQLGRGTARRRTSPSPGPGNRRNCPRRRCWRRWRPRTVVICRRCTSLVRPCGCRITMSSCARSRQASMAAEPVSPEVAPTMVTRWPRSASTWSNSRPSSCIARSLKASVGPWNSSCTQRCGLELDAAARSPGGRTRHRPRRQSVCSVVERHRLADEGLHHPRGQLGIGQAAHGAQVGGGEMRATPRARRARHPRRARPAAPPRNPAPGPAHAWRCSAWASLMRFRQAGKRSHPGAAPAMTKPRPPTMVQPYSTPSLQAAYDDLPGEERADGQADRVAEWSAGTGAPARRGWGACTIAAAHRIAGRRRFSRSRPRLQLRRAHRAHEPLQQADRRRSQA